MVALAVLVVMVFGLEGRPAPAEAQFTDLQFAALKDAGRWLWDQVSKKEFGGHAATTDDVVGCWVSGPLGGGEEASWGKRDDDKVGYDVVGDVRDVGKYVIEKPQLNKEGEGFSLQPEGGDRFFRTVPELVDYTFGMNLRSGGDFALIKDDRVEELKDLLVGETPAARKLPWSSGWEYMARRPVAAWAGNRLVSVGATWRDVDNPGGGTLVDHAEIARDAMAAQADLSVATTTMKGEGGETSFRQEQTPVLTFDGRGTLRCVGEDGATVCTENQEVETNPEVVESRSVSYEVNTGEMEERNVGRGERVVVLADSGKAVTVVVDSRALAPSDTVNRSKSVLGYAREGVRDIGDSTLDVQIELERGREGGFRLGCVEDRKGEGDGTVLWGGPLDLRRISWRSGLEIELREGEQG